MRKAGWWLIAVAAGAFILSGCVVRTYESTRDRVDQDLSSGNKGYLVGQSAFSEKERSLTRQIQVVEVELHSPIKFEKGKKEVPLQKGKAKQEDRQDSSLWGNQGYISGGPFSPGSLAAAGSASIPAVSAQKYTVQKGDTLQKISQKVYGTTKKWHKIFEANRDALKAPDRIFPGQSLDIPADNSAVSAKPHHKRHQQAGNIENLK